MEDLILEALWWDEWGNKVNDYMCWTILISIELKSIDGGEVQMREAISIFFYRSEVDRFCVGAKAWRRNSIRFKGILVPV